MDQASFGLSAVYLQPIWLTIKLAGLTTLVLLIFTTPLAWWLANTRSWIKQPLNALLALPLVLPPTVLGFYLLLLLGPHGAVGHVTQMLGLGTLPFTFAGLVVASCLYSLPFTLQPIQNAFETIGKRPLEVAATLRAGPWQCFFYIVLPLARPALITAAVLAFAHTLGEFGVVLMIGGNIPGATKVLSVAIYDHVEALEYTQAHWLAAGTALFSFAVLLLLYARGAKVLRVGP
ncbi:MAG TPA: molybdate ABC transporter permease subunit [Spongiibacteraceae bacterium]|nr:molybdate ABC transporter permease subunit [Spongiibacteraceae bacterium]